MGKYINEKLIAYRGSLSGKRVAALGFGRSNIPLARFLCDAGANVTVFDRGEAESFAASAAPLRDAGVSFCFGSDYLSKLVGFDVIYRTPGIRPDIQELEAERARGAEVTSEMEVFLTLCPCPFICVTGSDGKTTTSTLISLMLEELGVNCHLGGNIGRPLLPRIDSIFPDDAVVVELSSFQLMDMRPSPDVAVITNISPNHLDVHKSFEEYIEAKQNIFIGQKPDGFCVLNYDNEETRALASRVPGRAAMFSRKSDPADSPERPDSPDSHDNPGRTERTDRHDSPDLANLADRPDLAAAAYAAYCENSFITIRRPGEEPARVMSAKDVRLVGAHNLENMLAAACAVSCAGAKRASREIAGAILRTATTFGGVEHRIEFVRKIDGISYYNDSIATSPARAIACIDSFDANDVNIVLIAGGKDKNLDYKPFAARALERVKALVLCGQTSDKILKALEAITADSSRETPPAPIPVTVCDDYETALHAARSFAKPGDAVVLSPASASFDRFKNFEERGALFKRLVNNLPDLNGGGTD